MLSLDDLVERFRLAKNRWRFNNALSEIFQTPAQRPGKDPFVLLSMVHHRDVGAYLLAAKTLLRFRSPRRIVVLMDPTITAEDRTVLGEHIKGIEFLQVQDCREPGVPQGGCWERLLAISDVVREDYTVQLDADTVTLDRLAEVESAIERGESFVLGTEDRQQFVGCNEAAAWARGRAATEQHVQILCEANLDKLPAHQGKRYVRGCAGFSGFARGALSRQSVREFSETMESLVGPRWANWGTEQFASNFFVSNSPKAVVLPHPKYCHPLRERPGTVFLHFIGYVRFQTGRYAEVAGSSIRALAASSARI